MNGEREIHFNTETDCFSCYISDAKIGAIQQVAVLTNTSNQNKITFELDKIDKDGSGEDIYGWIFKAVSGHKKPCHLLIIND